jgi:hypothetical protein
MPKAKSVQLSPEVSTALAAWQVAQAELARIKQQEFGLRQQIILTAGFDPTKLEGSETLEIGQGWKLVAKKVQSYNLTNKNGETLALLNAIGAYDPALAQSLVDWQPELHIKPYREFLASPIAEAVKPQLAAALTVKPGSPQLELEAPKQDK